jgi:hypothetical protein
MPCNSSRYSLSLSLSLSVDGLGTNFPFFTMSNYADHVICCERTVNIILAEMLHVYC